MKVASVLSIFALGFQGVVAGGFDCNPGYAYCGSHLNERNPSNKGHWEENSLYECSSEQYTSSPTPCKYKCADAGQGKSDYCALPGADTTLEDETLSRCTQGVLKLPQIQNEYKKAKTAVEFKTAALHVTKGLIYCVEQREEGYKNQPTELAQYNQLHLELEAQATEQQLEIDALKAEGQS